MSESQEAAEIITSAVSPDANIIFGATLKPDLEDEIIITVIATGFDSEYFEEQAAQFGVAAVAAEEPAPSPAIEDVEVESVNMDLDQTDAAAEFAAEDNGDIWGQPAPQPEEDDESDMPAFLRRRKKQKSEE